MKSLCNMTFILQIPSVIDRFKLPNLLKWLISRQGQIDAVPASISFQCFELKSKVLIFMRRISSKSGFPSIIED